MTLAVAYQNFSREARVATVATVAATLFFILPLITAVCALTTLHLPGVSIAHLVPVLAPCAGAFALSIPLIVLSVMANRRKNRTFHPYLAQLKEPLDAYQLPKKGRDKKAFEKEMKKFHRYVLRELIDPSYSTDFRYFLVSELQKQYEKDSSMWKALNQTKGQALR